MTRFAIFFALQFVAYSLATWDIRAMAKGLFWNSLIVNTLIAALSFTLIGKVAEAKDHPARFGYILGGTIGSGCTLLLTKWLWNE